MVVPDDEARKAPTRRCEWSSYPCPKPAKSRSAYCAEHHAKVFKKHNPNEKGQGIGPLTLKCIRKAHARRKAKMAQGGKG